MTKILQETKCLFLRNPQRKNAFEFFPSLEKVTKSHFDLMPNESENIGYNLLSSSLQGRQKNFNYFGS